MGRTGFETKFLRSAKKAFWAAWKSVALISLICMSRPVLWATRMIVLLSPVYWITAPCNFNISSLFKCNTVLRQRTRKLFLIWNLSQVDLPYQGAFSSFETIQCSYFCCTAIAGHNDTPQLPNYLCNYIVHIYPCKKTDARLEILLGHHTRPSSKKYCMFILTTIVSMSSSRSSNSDFDDSDVTQYKPVTCTDWRPGSDVQM